MQARTLVVASALVALACSPDAPPGPIAPHLPAPIGEAVASSLPAAPASGILSLCQQAGAGLSAGQLFTSTITLAGVTRAVANATGGCLQLEVPREGTPQKKGWFQSTPAAIERLLPGTATLALDGVRLTRADVQAILGSAPSVQASSSLLLNLAQQLIAAELNVLRGVQASPQVMQPVADANAALRITLGSQITIATSLTTPQVSALVTALTAFNEGKTKPPAPPPSVNVDIVETFGSQIEIASIGCEPATSCDGANLVLGRVTTTVKSGSTTAVTYTNQSKPILRVCVVAGTGVTAGTVSHFDAIGQPETELRFLSFDVPAGECREAETDESALYELRQTPVAGVRVASIACEPSTHCTHYNPEVQSVEPFIQRGITTVTFTNRTALGTIRMCKIAGPGLGTDKQFFINADNRLLTPLPGEATFADARLFPGECAEKAVLAGDDYEVREFDDYPGIKLASITCEPAGRCGGFDQTRNTAAVDIVAGSTTTVNVTNRSTLGTLRVCVQEQAGVPPTAAFLIDVSPFNVVGGTGEPTAATPRVLAGQCQDVTLKEGTYTVSEGNIGPVFVPDNIACDPATRCFDFFPSSVKAEVVTTSTTRVTFTNVLSDTGGGGSERTRVRSP